MTAIANVKPPSELAVRLGLDQAKLELVRTQIAPGAPDDVLEMYFERCRTSGFDPFAKMLYAIKRNAREGNAWVERWTFQVAIDGFRSIAEDTGEYDGQDPPKYDLDERGRIAACTVTVYRKGMQRGVAATADWDEYVQTDREGNPSGLWKKMPRAMIAKCAEALALRKAFPKRLANIYTNDEMAQSENAVPARKPDSVDAEFTEKPALESTEPETAKTRTEALRDKVKAAAASPTSAYMNDTLARIFELSKGMAGADKRAICEIAIGRPLLGANPTGEELDALHDALAQARDAALDALAAMPLSGEAPIISDVHPITGRDVDHDPPLNGYEIEPDVVTSRFVVPPASLEKVAREIIGMEPEVIGPIPPVIPYMERIKPTTQGHLFRLLADNGMGEKKDADKRHGFAEKIGITLPRDPQTGEKTFSGMAEKDAWRIIRYFEPPMPTEDDR